MELPSLFREFIEPVSLTNQLIFSRQKMRQKNESWDMPAHRLAQADLFTTLNFAVNPRRTRLAFFSDSTQSP
jgi:hypothetical protein